MSAPTVALVGRPNVGKSTLFNRLVGKRLALVHDEPGVTRDRLVGDATLDGRLVRIVDTGGFDDDASTDLARNIRLQTELAVECADLVLLVVDGAQGLHPGDAEVARFLRRAGKGLVCIVNKVDVREHELRTADFHALGIDPVIAVSAEHGRGIDELHEAILGAVSAPLVEVAEDQSVPVVESEPEGVSRIEWQGGRIRVAVVGKPNVGKSSLINKLIGEDRLVASEMAGTTRDAIDVELGVDGQVYMLVDTAGMRRPRSVIDTVEQFAVLRAVRAIEQCDVAVVVLDGSDRPSDQDARICALAHERGKGVVLVANKWDLIENPEWRDGFPKAVRLDLRFVDYASLLLLSAKTGRGVHGLLPAVLDAQRERHRRISTGELNRFFDDVVSRSPPAMFKGKRAHFYFVSQPLVRPPTFVFTTRNPENVPQSYARHLRNALRECYGFCGAPIWLKFRGRGKQKQGAGSKLDQ